jgi:uncharacterized protein YjiS (DUF1127 family)
MEDFVLRNYALNRALSLEINPLASSLRNLWRNIVVKRNVTRLSDLDDHMLKDIGVTREEVEWAASLPLTTNAALALEERAFKRRRYEALR